MKFSWGLLGPETLPGARRTRTLGLASAVRHFNDRAVPGLGGVWYGKQVMLALLGVAVAEQARQLNSKFSASNIQVANAIEALACWSALNRHPEPDPRLRGREKLSGKQADDFVFENARKPGFYLTQPMRMQTVQALPALGLVSATGERFNTFKTTPEGLNFAKAACEAFNPYNREVVTHLTKWVLGEESRVDSNKLTTALSPLLSMPDRARLLLREHLRQGNTERRNALAWIESLKDEQNNAAPNEQRPAQIEEAHWRDIQAGALFFPLHDLAVAALDAVEADMGQDCNLDKGAKNAEDKLLALKDACQKFLDFNYKEQSDALRFCRECVTDPIDALRALVLRDETVLRWDGEKIRRGPAFKGRTVREIDPVQEPDGDTPVPLGLSYRLRNLYRLNLDLNGELDTWLKNNRKGTA